MCWIPIESIEICFLVWKQKEMVLILEFTVQIYRGLRKWSLTKTSEIIFIMIFIINRSINL